MTDLRSALLEACDNWQRTMESLDAAKENTLDGVLLWSFRRQHDEALAELARLRSIATSPLCVLDALRDPEVRAGRVWIAIEHEGWGGNCHRLVKIADGIIWVCRWRDGDIRGRLDWGPAVVRPADLDAPCRLVPAEGP
jgi:hypothetical protein